MSAQIAFYHKSACDISEVGVTATATQGNDYAIQILNRSNLSAWITTGSVDSDNPYIDVDMVDTKTISDLFLIKHNFKNYTVKYWNGSTFVDFSPAIAETNYSDDNSNYPVSPVETSKIRIQIFGTQVSDEDKYLYQFVATDLIGRLQGWPVIKNPIHGTNVRTSTMLSGKNFVTRNVGGFSCTLEVSNWKNNADLTLIETLYELTNGFLVYLCGGDESQFSSVRKGYRKEDLFLMKCMEDYSPEFVEGLYKTGLKLSIKLGEVVP